VAGLWLQLWDGAYEGQTDRWLRWALEDGVIIPTGAERAKIEAKRAQSESRRADVEAERARVETARADALAARLRELGIDP
jgi:hypothetical protein